MSLVVLHCSNISALEFSGNWGMAVTAARGLAGKTKSVQGNLPLCIAWKAVELGSLIVKSVLKNQTEPSSKIRL